MAGREPSVLSEEQARRLWERAAELQARAATREDGEERAGEVEAEARDDGSGYSLVHVRQAGLEAGIEAEFLDLALAEETLLALEGGAEERGVDRAARRFLGHPEEALEIRRRFSFPPARVWPVLERILTSAPHDLELLELRGGDPRSGGVAIFEAPTSYEDPSSLKYAAAFSDVRRFLLRLVPEGEGSDCEVLIRAPLRRSRRMNYLIGGALSSVGGVFGGLAGIGVAVLVVGSGGMAPAALAALVGGLTGGGALAGGGLTRRACQALYRWGIRIWERAVQKALSRVERELQREREEGRALPAREPPEVEGG